MRMSTPLRVSLYHGAWQPNDDGYWIFQRKPSDLGLKHPWRWLTTPPEWMLEPDETRRPPISVSTTSEVEAMMHLRSWFADLKLCISSGYEDVGHFQFLNKTMFTVGGATFVFNGYNDRELVASKDVLKEIFTEHEMVSIYRAYLEITNAKQNQQENAAESSVSSSKLTKEDASGSSPSLPGE
ncbi:hypothetical protein HID58_075407 [Brassica napus]|uniref:Uncharacterized protein n=2 Tax=Brassica napus TaxID=3708 RepID=A0ABQ7YJJ1_BRANA|nr:hypothetical protein HID58_075407 [Brassica napus]